MSYFQKMGYSKNKREKPRPREKQSRLPKVPRSENKSKSIKGDFKPVFVRASELKSSQS